MSDSTRYIPSLRYFDLDHFFGSSASPALCALDNLLCMSAPPQSPEWNRVWESWVKGLSQQLKSIVARDDQRPFCVPEGFGPDPSTKQTDDMTFVLDVAQNLCLRADQTLKQLDTRSQNTEVTSTLAKRITRLLALYQYIGANSEVDFSDSSSVASGMWSYVLSYEPRAPGQEARETHDTPSAARTALANARGPIPVNTLKLLHLTSNLLYRYCSWIEHDEEEALRASKAADEAGSRLGH